MLPRCEGSLAETFRAFCATCAFCGQQVKVTTSGRLFVHQTRRQNAEMN